MSDAQTSHFRKLTFRSAAPSQSDAEPRVAVEDRVLVNSTWRLAIAAGDVLSCALATMAAAWLLIALGLISAGVFHSPRLWITGVFFSCGIVFYLGRRGHYRHRHPFWTQARHVGFISALAFLICLFSQYAEHQFRPELLLGWLLLPPVLLAVRRAMRGLLDRRGLWRIRILVAGDVAACEQAQTAIRSEAAQGYEVAGVIDLRDWQRQKQDDAWHGHSWKALLLAHRAELLLIATEDMSYAVEHGIIEAVLKERVPLAMLPFLGGTPVNGCEQVSFFRHDVMLLKFKHNLADPLAILTKRIADLVITVVALVMLAPLLLTLILLIRRDGGPALFAHSRIGANGRSFGCLKLRTMVMDADARLAATLASDPEAARQWARSRKLDDDPRVTPIGRFLRLTSLDELPQLWNVLRGEMSLVGPRPIVAEEAELYGRNIDFYYEAKPGMTGLWQVSGRSDTTFKRRVELDVWYVKNWTGWNDIAIICMTVAAVLGRKGAR